MAGLIPENLLEDILSRLDIVEVISGYIQLKKAGRNFKANCPFHHEKTASFMVSPDRQIYHCFGCGESGNVFKFLMRHERMDFPEAVEILAKKSGVILPQYNKETGKITSLNSQLFKINEIAADFYKKSLQTPAAAGAWDYLINRGLKPETIKEFGLGLANGSWDGLLNFLRSKGVPLSLIEKAGLILPKDKGGYYDRFRNRIIFPISDVRARVIGFGARVMDSSLPKYVNSPETAIYIKGKNLFGLNFSKDFIRDTDQAVIVEGYLDFMIPYQEGIKNLVASQGTALTIDQIKLIKRYTQNIVTVFDGDNAGEMATLRSLDLLIDEGMQVKVVQLPKGKDPDTLLRHEGRDVLKDKIENAVSFFDYKLEVLKRRLDIKDPAQKGKIANEMLFTINKFKNAIIRAEYIKKLSEEMEVGENDLLTELGKLKEPFKTAAESPVVKSAGSINPAEKMLIKFMLEEKNSIEKIFRELSPSDLQDERTAKIMSLIKDMVLKGKEIAPNLLINYFNEDDARQLLCETVFMPSISENDKEKALGDCIARIKVERLKSQRELLHVQIKSAQSAGDEQRLNSLIQEFHNLIKKGD